MSGALAVFDLDGTITGHDTLGPFLWGYLTRHPWRVLRLPLGAIAPVRYLIDRDRGALKGSAIHTLLGGAPRESLDQWAGQFVSQLLPRGVFAQALSAIQQHRERGDRLLLMSASTDLYVPRIGTALGFDEVICTRVRWREDGRLDGRLASINCRAEEKRRALSSVIARDQPQRVYAYGNAGSDLPHMALAQEAFLVNPPDYLLKHLSEQVRPLHWS